MKHISPTILVIAAFAAAPGLHALSVKDDDLSLGLKLQLQVRAEKGWAQGADNTTNNVTENTGGEPDEMDFYVRRARIGFSGTWKGEYKFAYLMRTDNQDKAAQGGATRTPQTHVAYLERVIKQEDMGIEHGARMGLDYAWFNGTSAAFSSSSFLFPTDRATVGMLAPRGTGVGYKMSHKKFTWGVDVQNNTGDGTNTATGTDGSADQGEGLFIGSRVQVIAMDSEEKGHMKTVESFLGKEGKGVLISAEYGINKADNVAYDYNSDGDTADAGEALADSTVDTTAYGFEVLAHMDAITALAEWRQQITRANSRVVADDTNVSTCYLFQIGYALPMGDQVLEPAFRWTKLDSDADRGEVASYGGGEAGTSGYTWELGMNYYIHGHSNKLQLAYMNWRGEDGQFNGAGANRTYTAASADIVRFQWGLSF